MELQIEHIGGYCPVQAEGTVNGSPFYFRARGKRWSMNIGDDPVGIALGKKGWHREETYEGAGYMPLDIAEHIIRECAEQFTNENRSG